MNRLGDGVTKCKKETVCEAKSGYTIEGKDDICLVIITVHLVIYGRTVRLQSPLLSCSTARVGVKSEFRAILCTEKVLHFKLVDTRVFIIFFFMLLYSNPIRVTLKI